MSMPQAAVALLGLALLASPAAAEDADLALPPAPEVTVSVEAPARPAAAAAPAPASLDMALPLPPEAPVTITVADRLPALLAARLAEGSGQLLPRLGKKEREAIAAFYALGGYKPLWVSDGAWTPAAVALRERLARAGEEGLEPAGYPVPQIASGPDAAAEAASAELKLSAAAVLYARDARGARIEPGRLSQLITPKLELPAADAVLTALAASADPGETLQRFNPQHPGYVALKRKLAEMRSGASPAKGRLEEDVVANLERWRWLPSDLGPRHILVNVPEFKLRLIDQGRLVHQARVIVGKPETPTPLFSDVMDHAIVNPSWNVPPSIFKNEFYS
ncbi:MAG TPA: L,D-transpeptidase family protein, partial [Beijerinckiaceae bacterium]|nr:L,D-transpeptidase family protein [Beijerinckiaceae bacterium]